MKAVILAGGSGSRLWPLSRVNSPKQFQKLISEQTMLQETLSRLNFLKKSDIYIATNQKYLSFVQKQCPQIPENQIIVEPAMRDTATCIGYAALLIEHYHPGEVMSIIYSDHLIQNHQDFAYKLKIAGELAARHNTLNIIEVKAKFPNTNLGYVKIGRLLKTFKNVEVYALEKFIEKPDRKTAQQFANSLKYLWNTGYYVWKAKTILEKYQKYLPETYNHLIQIKKSLGTKNQKRITRLHYTACPKISIDYAIMEKVPPREVQIIPADFGWSDVGTWAALHEELAAGEFENIIKGSHLGCQTEGCLIINENDQLITTLGLKNLVVIVSPDVIFIGDKEKSRDLKKLIELLKRNHKKHL